MTSVMDEDGWKELAQLTFFVPNEQAESGKWQRQMTHDWGSLGSWYGETTFQSGDATDQYTQFHYQHSMKYQPPDKERVDLPFVIESAEFKLQQASGVIQFSQEHRRVVAVEEHFHTFGQLQTRVLRQPSPVNMEERQVLSIRVYDHNPWQAATSQSDDVQP